MSPGYITSGKSPKVINKHSNRPEKKETCQQTEYHCFVRAALYINFSLLLGKVRRVLSVLSVTAGGRNGRRREKWG